MMDSDEIKKEFRRRQSSQLWAMSVTLLLIILALLVYRRPDLFKVQLAKDAVVVVQLTFIAGFVAFSAINWRCPSCGKYLGGDLYREGCSKCKTSFR